MQWWRGAPSLSLLLRTALPWMRTGLLMSEPKQAGQPANGDESRASPADASADADAQQNQERSRQPQGNSSGAELKQRLDQVGKILARGLDLAEAGVSLGVTIVSRVGVAAQQKIREGIDAATASGVAPAGPGPMQPAEAPQSDAGSSVAESEPAYGITNRLPLTPGGTVKLSFSVNNDSMIEPKKVDLRIEGFTGDTQRARLDASTFTIKPTRKTIAPVDFEKFILQGSVPADAPPDVYRGAVTVESGTELRIPVVLVVMPP
jgi:hypothetical protein